MGKVVSCIAVLSALCAVLFGGGCEEDGLGLDPFDGITETDESGAVISEDPGDWCWTDPTEGTDSGGYVRVAPIAFSLPCSTAGESASLIMTLRNEHAHDVTVTTSCTDAAMSIDPESATVTAGGSFEFDATFTLAGENVHSGEIVFTASPPDTSLTVYFEAGVVPEWVDSGPDIAEQVPAAAGMRPAYPNPTAMTTTICFDVPAAISVVVEIYSSPSRVLTELVNGALAAGRHCVTWDVSDVPPGIYKCYLRAGEFTCQGDIEVQ